MNRALVTSSNLHSVGYNADTETLEIQFHGCEIYQYDNVPEAVYDKLMRAPSLGQFHAYSIKGQYHYRRIT